MRQHRKTALLFLAPFLTVFVAFYLTPVFYAIYLSLFIRKRLPDLGASSRLRQAAPLRPADEPAVQRNRFPRSAGRWKVGIGRSMPRMLGNGFHAPANPDPQRCGRSLTPATGAASSIR